MPKILKNLFLFILLASVLVNIPFLALGQQPPQDCFTEIGGGKVKVPCGLKGTTGPAGQETFGRTVTEILNIALVLVGSIAVAFLIYGGFRYITAYGNEEHAEAAKRIMRQAILGLVIVVLAFAIINLITRLLILGRVGA